MLGRLMRTLGAAMVLVGLGLVALFFVGLPGGTAGNIPAEAETSLTANTEDHATTLYLTVPDIGIRI